MKMETKEKALILVGKFRNKILDVTGYSSYWKGSKSSGSLGQSYVYVLTPKEVGSYEVCYRIGSVRIGVEKEDKIPKAIKAKESKPERFIVVYGVGTYSSLTAALVFARSKIKYGGSLVQVCKIVKILKKECKVVEEDA
jgi:hypothetical protein